MNVPGMMESLHTSPKPGETWVHEVLEPEQLSTAKRRFGRATLTGGTVVLLWGLRIYVVLMTLLIGVQIWNAMHPAS
jgi:hypothetical protein